MFQIHRILSQDRYTAPVFRGVFPSDKIPALKNGAYVINTSPSHEATGHWVAIWKTSNNAEYFDSYGRQPIPSIKRKLKAYTHNTVALQSPLSAVCGQYCIYYLLHRSRGTSLYSMLKQFTWDVDENDQMVFEFVEDNFELNAKLIDTKEFVNQLARSLVFSTTDSRNTSKLN